MYLYHIYICTLYYLASLLVTEQRFMCPGQGAIWLRGYKLHTFKLEKLSYQSQTKLPHSTPSMRPEQRGYLEEGWSDPVETWAKLGLISNKDGDTIPPPWWAIAQSWKGHAVKRLKPKKPRENYCYASVETPNSTKAATIAPVWPRVTQTPVSWRHR